MALINIPSEGHVIFQVQTANNTVKNASGDAKLRANFPVSYEVSFNANRDVPITGFGQTEPKNYAQRRMTCEGSYSYYLSVDDPFEYYISKNYFSTTVAGTEDSNGVFQGRNFKYPAVSPEFGLTAHVQTKKGTQANTVFQTDLFITSRSYTFEQDDPNVLVTVNFIGGTETALNTAAPQTSDAVATGTLINRMNTRFGIATGVAQSPGSTDFRAFKSITATQKTGINLQYGAGKEPIGTYIDHAENDWDVSVVKDLEQNDVWWRYAKSGELVSIQLEELAATIGTGRYWALYAGNMRLESGAPTITQGNPTEVEYSFRAEEHATQGPYLQQYVYDTME